MYKINNYFKEQSKRSAYLLDSQILATFELFYCLKIKTRMKIANQREFFNFLQLIVGKDVNTNQFQALWNESILDYQRS